MNHIISTHCSKTQLWHILKSTHLLRRELYTYLLRYCFPIASILEYNGMIDDESFQVINTSLFPLGTPISWSKNYKWKQRRNPIAVTKQSMATWKIDKKTTKNSRIIEKVCLSPAAMKSLTKMQKHIVSPKVLKKHTQQLIYASQIFEEEMRNVISVHHKRVTTNKPSIPSYEPKSINCLWKLLCKPLQKIWFIFDHIRNLSILFVVA